MVISLNRVPTVLHTFQINISVPLGTKYLKAEGEGKEVDAPMKLHVLSD
jgi:hypothetical protein